MFEYTFMFEGNTKSSRTTSVFIASSEDEAYQIAENYIFECLGEEFDIIECSQKPVSMFD
jgi:hypothetical protein